MEIECVHIVKVEALYVYSGETVRRDICPFRISFILLVCRISELGIVQIVPEPVNNLFRPGIGSLAGIGTFRRAANVETHIGIILLIDPEIRKRNMRRIERVTDNGGQTHGKFVKVKHRGNAAASRVCKVIIAAFGTVPPVNETFTVVHPHRSCGRGVNHTPQTVERKALCKFIIWSNVLCGLPLGVSG